MILSNHQFCYTYTFILSVSQCGYPLLPVPNFRSILGLAPGCFKFYLEYVPVPDNDLGPVDGCDKVFGGLGSNIQTHPTFWNTLLNGSLANLSIS